MKQNNFLKKIYSVFIMSVFMLGLIFPSVSKIEAAGPTSDVLGYAWSYHPHEQGSSTSGSGMRITYIPPPGPNITSFGGEGLTGTEGLGWISMSGTNPNAGNGDYQVKIDPATGKFSGYAWSENGGWVNFAPSGPFPSAAGTTAQPAFVDPACFADKTRTCSVKGWIRFVEGTTGNSSWDGWVNMEIFNDSTAASAYSFPRSAPASGVKLLPELAGFRPMAGYAWGDALVGIVGFSKAKIQLTDVCPDTKFVMTSDLKNIKVDPKTAGTQTTIPAGYSVKTINGVEMCGIFGCTDKTAANYVKTATVDDGSCKPPVDACPDTKYDMITDQWDFPTHQFYLNGTYIPKTVGIQATVPAGYSVVDGRCALFKCTDKTAINYNKDGQIDDGSCIYKGTLCPDGITLPPNGDVNQCPDPKCTPKSDDYNPFTKTCQTCNRNSKDYDPKTGLCTTDPTCPDGSAIPPGGCPSTSNVCTTVSPTYNPIFKDCRECHPGVTGYNTTTGLCTVTVQCESTSPDYNPITKDCRTCHPGVAGYNTTTGRCSIPGKHKTPIFIES